MADLIPSDNKLFHDMLNKSVLIVTESKQLNILGQTFRPIFTGVLAAVETGFVTLDPVIIKMHNAPFYRFPTPLSFPIEHISLFTEFDMNRRIPLI